MSLVLVSAALVQPLAPGTATAQRHTGSLADTTVMTSTLDSLERVALTATEASERARAALTITAAGRLPAATGPNDTEPPQPRYPGVVARLATIYRKTADPAVRDLIVQWMPALADRPHAIAFLASVASEAPAPDSGQGSRASPRGHDTALSRAYVAVYALTRMGAEGRATLARLDVRGAVRNPDAKAYLARLAKEGYKNHE